MPGQWREFYRQWPQVTRERLKAEFLDLVPMLERFAPPAHIFDKQVYSAFADGRLARWLAERNVGTLLIRSIAVTASCSSPMLCAAHRTRVTMHSCKCTLGG